MCEYSVIITSYQRPVEIVQRAVNSVFNQTNPNFEILIIDDNKDDSSYSQELKTTFFGQDKIRYIKQDGNKGACAARNLGIYHAKADFVAFLDDDDTWEAEKAETQLKAFQEDVGMVYCLGYLVNSSTGERRDYYTKSMYKEEVSFDDLLVRDHIGSTSQAMVRKSIFDTCGGFLESLPARQDYEMWLRISKKYRIIGVNRQLFNHYIHDAEQISANPKKALRGFQIVHKIYRKDYRKNYMAETVILNWMREAAKKGKFAIYLYYWFRCRLRRR